ncbi:hypothetical protein D7X98_02815 [bacterium 1XD8-76]|nr:hypothetical protein D7X98_02815 [bacterium 1XD8-76]
MKITFEQMQGNNGVQGRGAEKPQAAAQDNAKKAEKAGAYSVDIGGQGGRGQDGTYKKADMTADEISMQASQMDMDVQRMYMAVMSNSMSQEEFNEMLEEGVDVSNMDIETMVTILDQIKVAVAKGGGEIAGFTDKLSKETMEEILGSSAYAQALESGLEEGAVAYMVDRQLPPTAENIYKAKYSAGAYRGQKDAEIPGAEDAEFWDQIDKVIDEAGLPRNEESREDAAFLLRHDIPLTEENLRLYEKVKAFGPDGAGISEEELKYRIGMQIYEGKAAYQADLSSGESIYEQAAGIYETVQGLTPEAAEKAASELPEGRDLTLKDLAEAQKRAEQSDDTQGTESRELLTARRQLEEVRLRMTIEANVKLLRSGFQIDTAPMEELIERLRTAEEMLTEQGIPQTAEVMEKIDGLRAMPAATLSYVVSREISFTIEALHEKGSELQSEFARADSEQVRRETARGRYETMQTEVRADLGDSIRKAFRNVDDILTDMNREPSEENRRAVRMLGYNRLEISEENLDRALEVDRKVQSLFRDMKPGRVLQMIRDGVDVLHTDIGQLDDYLTRQGSGFMEESEDFARFLYKLDKNGAITAEERESYVGIYRLVRQVEKSDGKAQGYLLGSEAELTMENLLAAVRSGRRGNMDYRVDENFAGVDALQRGRSIIDQIEAAPYECLEGYEEAVRAFRSAEKKAGQAEAVDFLKEMQQPVTVSNLLEASSVLQESAEIYQRIEDCERESVREENLEGEQSRLEGYVASLQETMTDEASLREGMEAFAEQTEEILREAEYRDGATELDIRNLQRLSRGIRFRAALSRESRYQIPVKLEEGYAVMNLTVRMGTGTAQAEISLATEEYGRLEALFTRSEEKTEGEAVKAGVSGTFFAETEDGAALLESISGKIREKLQENGTAAEGISVIRGSRVKRGTLEDTARGAEKAEAKEISTGELYQIAKIFVETVRNEY